MLTSVLTQKKFHLELNKQLNLDGAKIQELKIIRNIKSCLRLVLKVEKTSQV